jgi:hypothetical protein
MNINYQFSLQLISSEKLETTINGKITDGLELNKLPSANNIPQNTILINLIAK